MSLARLALQVGLIFCIGGAAAGIAAELSTETIIWRSLLCAVLGAALGAGLGALARGLFRLGQDPIAMPVDGDPLSSEALTTGEADGHGG
jgi:hypothetical protein